MRLVVAAVAGAVVWASFPPVSQWWAAPIGIAALLLAVRSCRPATGAAVGYAFGLGFLVPMMSFLRGIGVDAWLVVAAIEAVWFAAQGAAFAVLTRRAWWPAAVPAVWVGVEWVRDRWPFGGFPWARVAFGQASGPLLPLAAWGGAALVSVAVVGLGAAVAWALMRLARQVRAPARTGSSGPATRRLVPATVAVAVVAAVSGGLIGVAAAVPVPTSGTSAHGAPTHVVVAAVQGDVPRLGLDAFAQRRVVTQNHVRETEVLAARVGAGDLPRPAFVVWPENASDQDPFVDPVARGLIEQAVQTVGVPVVVGAVLDGPDARHVQNAAIVWSPQTGPGERYVKQHLVPFGEYLPLRGLLTRIAARFQMIAKDFAPGHRPGVLDVSGTRIGDVICFEVADDAIVRATVTGGGRLLVVQTNNATYEHQGDGGHGGETAQQLQMSRLRAVEHGRAVVVAATSGVSAIIAPDGRVLMRSGVFVPAVLEADVPLRDPRTVADSLGAAPEDAVAAVGAILVAVAVAAVRRPRRTRRGSAAAGAPPAVVAGRP